MLGQPVANSPGLRESVKHTPLDTAQDAPSSCHDVLGDDISACRAASFVELAFATPFSFTYTACENRASIATFSFVIHPQPRSGPRAAVPCDVTELDVLTEHPARLAS